MSKSSVGKVLEMFVSGTTGRQNRSELTLDSKGVLEDKYYDRDIDRSVLITSIESYELASHHGIETPHGALGENILIEYNPYHLSPGEKMQMGEVVFEMSQNCTLCKSLTKVNPKLPKLLKNDRGIFAKVIKGGMITQGDNIYLLKEEKSIDIGDIA